MRSAWTVLTLALLFFLAIAFRRRWPTLSFRSRVLSFTVISLLLLARSLENTLRWEVTSSRLNDLFVWTRIAAYLLFVVLFTRIRPRALTTVAAAVLLLPLFTATVYLPLELLFDQAPRARSVIGEDVLLEQIPWSRPGNENRAVDYTVSRRSRSLPLLQRVLFVGRLYRTQCDIDAISASMKEPDEILLHCPSGAPGEPPVDEEIPLTPRAVPPAPAVIPSEP